MKVKDLIEALQFKNPELDIVAGFEENGWYSIDEIEEVETEEGEKVINLQGEGM